VDDLETRVPQWVQHRRDGVGVLPPPVDQQHDIDVGVAALLAAAVAAHGATARSSGRIADAISLSAASRASLSS